MSKDYAEQCVRYMLHQYHSNSPSFDFIKKLEQLTGLVFIASPSQAESLCFADSEAVRADYKIGFTAADLWAYVNSQLKPQQTNTDVISFLPAILPKTSQQFWQGVKLGRD